MPTTRKFVGTLIQQGYRQAETVEEAGYVFYNTCSIRDKAEQKVFNRLQHFKRDAGKGKAFAVIGCVAQQEGEKIFERARMSAWWPGRPATRSSRRFWSCSRDSGWVFCQPATDFVSMRSYGDGQEYTKTRWLDSGFQFWEELALQRFFAQGSSISGGCRRRRKRDRRAVAVRLSGSDMSPCE